MVEEIRVKWCNALEELLQCPVCLDISQGIQVQCTNGHHICKWCRLRLKVCPVCKSSFIATRNLVVEQLSAKLHDIKLSLLHPYHALNRRILHNKVCVATQTEVVCVPSISSACQTEPVNQATHVSPRNEQQKPVINLAQQKPVINLAPRVGKGLFPCRIGSCTVKLPHGRIIGHLRYHHKDMFYEFNARNTVFKKKWSLDYRFHQNYDFAFHIKEMGLFFLNVSIDGRGNLTAFVQIVNCTAVSKQYIYTLKAVGTFIASYTGQVKSCRVSPDCISNDCLHVHKNDMRLNMLDDKGFFHCNLTIDSIILAIDQLPSKIYKRII